MSDGDVSSNGLQFGAPPDLAGADMAAARAQRSVSRNVAYINVSASGESRQVTRDIQNLNVPALCLQFGSGAPPRSVPHSRNSDASRLDVPTLGVKQGGATNIRCRDVASLCVHFDAVAARHGDFKLHPELGISGARRLRRKHAGDFHPRGNRLCLERVSIEELLSCGAARIRFYVYGVTHDGRGAGLELDDIHGAEIGRQPQRQTISGTHRTIANNGGMLRTRVSRLGAFKGLWIFSFAGKHRRCELCYRNKQGQHEEQRHTARDGRESLLKKYVHRPMRFLTAWPITALRAGQSAARRRRCASARSGWDPGVATVAARAPRVPRTGHHPHDWAPTLDWCHAAAHRAEPDVRHHPTPHLAATPEPSYAPPDSDPCEPRRLKLGGLADLAQPPSALRGNRGGHRRRNARRFQPRR